MSEETIKVFVYGTLKVGGKFSHPYEKIREYVKKASINGEMYSCGGSFPAVILGGDKKVVGELHQYKNPTEVLKRMDMLEGYQEGREDNFYNRRVVEVETEDGKEECYMYEFNQNVANMSKVETGNWEI